MTETRCMNRGLGLLHTSNLPPPPPHPKLLTCELLGAGRKLSGFVRPGLSLIFKSSRFVMHCRDGGVSVRGGGGVPPYHLLLTWSASLNFLHQSRHLPARLSRHLPVRLSRHFPVRLSRHLFSRMSRHLIALWKCGADATCRLFEGHAIISAGGLGCPRRR
ncbi:hypothetical protein AAC387_Pa02g1790 [Persea americana]